MTLENLFLILFLIVLEGLLSFDNALVLSVMVKHLPETQKKRALYYGILGAFLFRALSLTVLTYLIRLTIFKVLGAVYLLSLSGKYFFEKESDNEKAFTAVPFWKTVILIELADIAFSFDSITASIAVSDKMEIVLAGGILGIIMMRFTASIFINLVEKFPRLETSAFLLVALVGTKLLFEAFTNLNFKNGPMFWAFRSLMLLSFIYGFTINGEKKWKTKKLKQRNQIL